MASTYTWSLIAGVVPPGLSLTLSETDLDIDVTGTPTLHGTYNFTVRIENDVSGAFDEREYTIVVDAGPSIQLTPDTGQPISAMFNPALNPKLVYLPLYQMTDVSGQDYSTRFGAVNKLRIRADLGTGVKTYEFPQELTGGITVIGRKYLWRTTLAPNTISEIIIV